MVLRESQRANAQLTREPTVTAEAVCTNLTESKSFQALGKRKMAHLTAGMVPQVVPVDFEPALVKHVYHLVHHRVLHVGITKVDTLAHNDGPLVRMETTSVSAVARRTYNVRRRKLATGCSKMLHHENYRGTCGHELSS
jgi:hypothetical protein